MSLCLSASMHECLSLGLGLGLGVSMHESVSESGSGSGSECFHAYKHGYVHANILT
jgi:hypothetical protein